MSGVAYKYYQEIEGCRRSNLEILTLERIADVFGLEAFHLFSSRLPATRLKPLREAPAPHKQRKATGDSNTGAARRAKKPTVH